ncbi:MAG TPA: alpha/beta hydrolase, partial [Geminicoccaceae bacterium]|nr:alpha/beta hydrolase [Geminicoccaceae bacterium]
MRIQRLKVGDGPDDPALAWVEWGEPGAARMVVCVHGLTRNARDFDFLARRLARSARVLCVDVAGRGGSDWLRDPEQYDVEVYARHLRGWLDRLGLHAVDWVGTSMGGLIGMTVAAAETNPIERLVLNDIGPLVPKAALEPLKLYLGLDLAFEDLAALEQHLRLIHAPFGPLSDAQWRHLAEHSVRRDGNVLRLHYDPQIRVPFLKSSGEDIDLWERFDRIRCPTLVLRGGESTLLPAEAAQAMTERGPRAKLVTFPGIGHAPALMSDDQ